MGRGRAHWGGLAALGTVVAWTPVLAQTADVSPTNDVRHFTIAPQVETTYDTNVAGTDAAGAALRHLTPEDVDVQPAVAIDALEPVGRESIFLTGLIGYDFYDRNPELNRERINLAGGVSARLSRCQPRLKGSYARSQTQLAALLPGPAATSASPQNVSTLVGASVDVSCPRAEGLSPTITVSYSNYENSSKFYQATNNHNASAQGGLSYARSGFGAIQTYGSFTSVDYDSPFVVLFPPFLLKNNFDEYAGGVRYDRPVDSRLTGSISVAYTSLRPALSFNPGFSGLTYSAELSYKMSTRWGVHALVSRATLPTNQVGAAYSIDNSRQIDTYYNIGARLKLTLGAFDDPQSYHGALVGKLSGLLTSERIDRVFGSLNMTLSRRLSVVFDVTDERRNSNVALYNYNSDRVSLTLKGVF